MRSVSGDNLLFYDSTLPWLRLQQEAESVNINFDRGDLKFHRKVTLPPMILEKIAFSFTSNLKKQNATNLTFTFLTQNLLFCH